MYVHCDIPMTNDSGFLIETEGKRIQVSVNFHKPLAMSPQSLFYIHLRGRFTYFWHLYFLHTFACFIIISENLRWL